MDALVDDRDVLLLARARDLQHEYENLVRSLDAAYDAVRQINAAMAENRSEAKRVFQERLEVLELRRNAKKSDDDVIDTERTDVVDEPALIDPENADVTKKPRTVLVTAPDRDKLARYVIALATRKNKGPTPTVTDQNNSRVVSDAVAPGLIYYSQQRTNSSQRVVTKGYVGDEHSYAEIDTKTGLIGHSATREKETRDGIEAEVDLTIVKAEFDDESNDCEKRMNSVVDDDSKDYSSNDFPTTSQSAVALTAAATSKLKLVQREACEYRIQGRRKTRPMEKSMDEEALKRKRVMTRNRMRRWRAKKRLEQIFSRIGNISNKDKTKYLGV